MRKKTKIPKRISKLLIPNLADVNNLSYQLGRQDIYLEKLKPIHTNNKNEHTIPKIAVVRYHRSKDITSFIEHSGIFALRIFKSGIFRQGRERKTKAFFYTLANNLLALSKGHTLRIKSKCPDLQKELYDICVAVEKEKAFGVTFDYDIYDVKVEIREYKEAKRTWIVVTTKGLSEFLED